MPKTEVMDKRLGSLVDEFKELVYPPDYNPEGKVTKRKKGKELGMDVQWVSFFFWPHCTAYRADCLCFHLEVLWFQVLHLSL